MRKASMIFILPLLIGCNQLEDIPFVDEMEPTLLAAENLDLSSDGFTDTIRLTFDERIGDETVNGGDFSVNGINNIDFEFDTNGDKSHDEIIHLSIDDGVHSVNLALDLTYTQGTLADLSDNLLPGFVITTTPPVFP